MKKITARTVMNVYTIFNLANVIAAFSFELLRPYFGANGFMLVLGNILFYLVSAYSYLAIPGFLFSLAGVIYYFRGCLKWKDRSSAYLFLMIAMINVVGVGYFIMLATATM